MAYVEHVGPMGIALWDGSMSRRFSFRRLYYELIRHCLCRKRIYRSLCRLRADNLGRRTSVSAEARWHDTARVYIYKHLQFNLIYPTMNSVLIQASTRPIATAHAKRGSVTKPTGRVQHRNAKLALPMTLAMGT